MANMLLQILWIHCVLILPYLLYSEAFFIYPTKGGIVKLIMSVGVPVKLGKKQNMAWAMNFQYQYLQATSYAQLSGPWPPVYARGKTDMDCPMPAWTPAHARGNKTEVDCPSSASDRAIGYLGLEKLLSKYGVNGRECLLHSICQNAMSSVDHDGLLGELIHIFLTPDYGDGEAEPDLNPEYLEAQRTGEAGMDCDAVYKNCPASHALMDMVSIVQDISS